MNLPALLAASLPCLLLTQHAQSRLASATGRGRSVWATFLLGAVSTGIVLAVAPALGAGALLPASVYGLGLEAALLRAAIPEEAAKFLVLAGFAAAWGHVRDVRSGVAHGLAASLGFASVEMVLFAAQGGMESAVLRTFTAVPCHALLGVLMGWYAGRAAAARAMRKRYVAAALGVPVLVHCGYDFPLMVLARANRDGVPIGTLEVLALATVGTGTLVVGALAAFRVYRASFPRVSNARSVRWSFAYAAHALGSGVVAWFLIPVGGVVASTGAWIVGSLLFVEMPGLESVPNARAAVAALYAVGASLMCFGLAFAFRGIWTRHASA
jgi:hypothetical protein